MITTNGANTHLSEDFASLLEPGFREIFYTEHEKLQPQYSKIFKMETSTRSFEKMLGMGAFAQWDERVNDTDNVEYQKIGQGLERTFTHKEFASGFAVGIRLYEDDQYNMMNEMPKDLAEGGNTRVENDCATVFNDGFTTNGYDGVSLFSASHPYEGGKAGTQSNLATGVLSDANLKLALSMFGTYFDNGGKKIVFMPDTLIIPRKLEWEARKILNSALQSDTADNNINTLMGQLKIVVYDYLTSDTAWFLMDSRKNKLKFFWRIKPQFGKSKDSDNYVAKYNGRMRYSYGYADYLGIIGSTGV